MERIRPTIISIALILLVCSGSALAQSRDLNFPTAVSTNEINGSIKARDVGDSRLTSYYFVFDGSQGDIFINVVTKNFNGDIDVFAKDGLRSLAKMVIYASPEPSETGRLVYLRKSERLILRIQGRSPNDDPATFRIKFGGSFVAITDQKEEAPPTIEKTDIDSKTRVNSVGTIVAIPPSPAAKKNDTPKSVAPAKGKENVEGSSAKTSGRSDSNKSDTKSVVIAEDNAAKKVTGSQRTTPVKTADPAAKTAANVKPPGEKKVDPLAGIRLVIQLKDGSVIERPMSEVSKFIVDKGILTVTAKDGRLSRFSILDVAKVTIE